MTTRLVAFGFLVRGYENEDDATVLDSLDGASNICFPVSQEFDIVQDRKGGGRAEKEVTLWGVISGVCDDEGLESIKHEETKWGKV